MDKNFIISFADLMSITGYESYDEKELEKLVEGIFDESFKDKKILEMMKKLSFEADEELDSKFPARRICRMEIETQNGKKYLSADCEPRGEAYENIGYDWLADKFRRITAPVLTKEGQEAIINLIESDENLSIRTLVDTINSKAERLKRRERQNTD